MVNKEKKMNNEEKKIKIHIVSNPLNVNTGFSIVARNLAIGLKKMDYDVTATGMQQSHRPEIYYGIESFPILGTNIDEIGQLILNIRELDPDIILNIFSVDSGQFIQHAMVFDSINILNEGMGIKKKIKSFWYPPIETLGLSDNTIRHLKIFIDTGGKIISQCRWGQREMTKAGIENTVIYHGVDDSIFRPLNDKEINKICTIPIGSGDGKIDESNIWVLNQSNDCRILRWDGIGWNEDKLEGADRLIDVHRGKFVFLTVAANLGVRKRLERAMKAYAIFLRKGGQQLKDRTVLHIHTQPFNPEGVNVLGIAEKMGIEKNIVFSYGRWKGGWTDVEMSVLYNSCRNGCFLSASSGEGFGIGTLESMACGIPVIGPRNTSFIELVEEEVKIGTGDGTGDDGKKIGPRGILVGGEYQMMIDGSDRFLVNEEELAEAMKRMYEYGLYVKDSNKLSKEGTYDTYKNNCLKFTKMHTWNRICKQWNELFKNL